LGFKELSMMNTVRVKRSLAFPVVAALAFGTLRCHAAHADFLLKANDRVVFFGDSITEEHFYTRPFQDYVYARYPERHIRFFNAGWSGDQLGGGLNRLQRDVLSRKPSVVTICFGMNDGHYAKISDDSANAYRKNLDAIVKILTDQKIRVVIFSPPPVDYDQTPPWLKASLSEVDYNGTLSAFGTIGTEVARKYGATYIDILHPILNGLNAMKAKQPTYRALRDGVHPTEQGGVVMAGAMLLGMGAEPMPFLADVSAAQLGGPNKSEVPVAGRLRVPFWMSDDSVAPASASGFLPVAASRLRVRGLAPGRYEVRIGDSNAGLWSAADLGRGVLVPGTFSARAKRINEVTNWKEANYYNAWRVLNLDRDTGPASEGAVAGLLKADDGFQEAIDSLNTPLEEQSITVKSTGLPENIGQNLALGKPYQASDPNVYNYGTGGLTDGSWSGAEPHTFASGEKDAFPKTATIDLGQVSPVSHVLLGVPSFGSTKTVSVSVSSDGQNFTDKGSYVFSSRKEERHVYAFPATPARYIRLTYSDHYPQEFDYHTNFAFTSEVEVYGPTR
jgi:lysophospholipase L1-like esterase